MIYRQKRRFNNHHNGNCRSVKAQNFNVRSVGDVESNYRPEVMTLHALGVSAVSTDNNVAAAAQRPRQQYCNRPYTTHNNRNAWNSSASSHTQSSYNTPHRNAPSSHFASSAVQSFYQPQRLHKILAHLGIGARRDIEQLILEGRITVNGRPAELGRKVGSGDVVRVNGQIIKLEFKAERTRMLMYYKPEGELVTRDDPEGRSTVFDKLPKITGGRWVSIGRLDCNTSGLLLFTTSGDLAHLMMHPRFCVEREYSVRVNGRLSSEQICQLTDGVSLDDGIARFDMLVHAHPDAENLKDGVFKSHEPYNHWYRVTICEGRNREVRRMFEAVGMQVTRLVRIRFGDFYLPQSLKRGQWREIDEKHVSRLVEKVERDAGGAAAANVQDHKGNGNVKRRRWLAGRRRFGVS